jgi:hypothetical protein
MKAIRILAVLALVLFAGCGGDSKKKEGTDVTPQDGVTADGTTEDGVEADQVEPGDVIDGEIAEEVAGPDVDEDAEVPPESIYSAELIEKFCGPYCNEAHGCETVTYGETCLEECIAKATADESFLKVLACANNAEEDGEYCDGLANCPDDYELSEQCVDLCADVEACGALGTEFFGNTVEDCSLVCTASVGIHPGGQAILDCISEPLAQCSGIGFVGCIDPGQQETICETYLCTDQVEVGCELIPEPFETEEACLAACDDFGPGPNMAAQICADMAGNMPVDCQTSLPGCLDVPDTLPEGALDYCKAFAEKCGPGMMGELFEAIGGLAFDFCAWQITGIIQVKPDGFQPLTEAGACIDTLPKCPSGDLASLYCLLDITEEHKTACTKVSELCTEADVAADVTLQCEAALGFAKGFMPDATAMIQACLDNAGSCDDLSDCFFGGDEEEQ